MLIMITKEITSIASTHSLMLRNDRSQVQSYNRNTPSARLKYDLAILLNLINKIEILLLFYNDLVNHDGILTSQNTMYTCTFRLYLLMTYRRLCNSSNRPVVTSTLSEHLKYLQSFLTKCGDVIVGQLDLYQPMQLVSISNKVRPNDPPPSPFPVP